jgi:hypothetical protein
MPKFNRRSFIVGSSAAGAGLALGFKLPFGPEVVRAEDGSPEIDAWVVIKPDDTIVIRIARSEMGQGTLTGLAQLVAEELDADWSKVTTEFPTPGQNVARKRVWGDFSTGGSRGIRESNEYVRKGGAMARMMLVQAAADAWKVPVAECSAANSVITHKASNRKTTYGKVAEAAAKLEPPKDVPLKDPKTWTIAGKPLKRLDTADKIVGKMIYGIDIRQPNMLYAAVAACPVFGGKLQNYDAAKVQEGARRHADHLGRRRQRQGLQRLDRGIPQSRSRRRRSIRRQQDRRRQDGACRRRQSRRGGLFLSVPEPRTDGADECHRALHGGPLRGVVLDAERRSRIGRDRRGVRPAGRAMRRAQDLPWRRFWPARPDRLRASGGVDCQADAGHAGEAVVVA